MNRRKTTGIVASVALALLGSIVLFKVVSAKSEAAAPVAAEPMVQIWAATKDIPKGTPAKDLQPAGLIAQKAIRQSDRQPDAVTDLAVIADKLSADPIYTGEQLLIGRFVSLATARSSSVDPGKIAVTMILSADRIGDVKNGDTVGVVGTFAPNAAVAAAPSGVTHFLLHKVSVLNVSMFGAAVPPTTVAGADINQPLAAGQYAVTLAVEAADAERLIFISQFGIVNLVSEPLEAVETNTKLVTFDNIYTPTPRVAAVAGAPQTGAAPAANVPAATKSIAQAVAKPGTASTPTTSTPAGK